MGSVLFATLFVALQFATGLANPDSKRLYDDLLSNYNRLIRPVGNNSDRLTVKMGLRLSQLIDVVSTAAAADTWKPQLTNHVLPPTTSPEQSICSCTILLKLLVVHVTHTHPISSDHILSTYPSVIICQEHNPHIHPLLHTGADWMDGIIAHTWFYTSSERQWSGTWLSRVAQSFP